MLKQILYQTCRLNYLHLVHSYVFTALINIYHTFQIPRHFAVYLPCNASVKKTKPTISYYTWILQSQRQHL